MKILFVLRDVNYFERFGVMYLSSLLKQKKNQVEFCFTLSEDIHAVMRELQPQIVAYSLTTGFHNYYLQLNAKLKAKYHFFAVAGGPHATFYPSILKENNLNAICRGEGEEAFLDLVAAIEKKRDIRFIKNIDVKIDSKVYTNELRPLIEDLDQLPFPDRAAIYSKNKYFHRLKIKCFMTGRGCPYRCSYCFNREYNQLYKGNGKIVRKRSPGNVIAEIKDTMENYPLEIVRFMDDTFIVSPRSWLREFAPLYKQEIGLPYVCMGRYELCDKDTVKLLKDSGCISIYNAIEAGNEHIRNQIACRSQTVDQIVDGSRRIHNAGIKICAENIVGFPTETIDQMFETIKLNIDVRVDCAVASILNPYPGTEIARLAAEHGCFDDDAYKNTPTSFFSSSPLKYSDKEKQYLLRIRLLFNIFVAIPFLYRFRFLLIELPLTKIYFFLSEITHIYSMRFKIFPIRLSLIEIVQHFVLFFRRNRE